MAESSESACPPLREIYFYLTEACNLRCRHCWISPGFQGSDRSHSHLDPALFAAILDQALPLGLTGVKLSGGEPLLHPAFPDILRMAQTRGLHLTLETNGVLCTEELAHALAGYGRALVSVSLDGADAATHEWLRGVQGCFQATLEGLQQLVQAGLKPQLVFTLIRRNVEQVTPIILLAERLGAGSIKFNLLQPTERGALLHCSEEALTVREMVELGSRVERQAATGSHIPILFHHPPAFRPLSRLFGESGGGCAVCGIKGILGVLHDGSYALCGIGQSTPDLVFGRADRVSLAAVWQGHPVLQAVRRDLPARLQGICRACLMQGICLGSCAAQNYYRHGNLWGPFWFCEQAYQEHLFPATRLRPEKR